MAVERYRPTGGFRPPRESLLLSGGGGQCFDGGRPLSPTSRRRRTCFDPAPRRCSSGVRVRAAAAAVPFTREFKYPPAARVLAENVRPPANGRDNVSGARPFGRACVTISGGNASEREEREERRKRRLPRAATDGTAGASGGRSTSSSERPR